MNQEKKVNKRLSNISESSHSVFPVLKSRFLYIALITFIAGASLNIASQTYLHNYTSEGNTLPMLNDLILDNIPSLDVALYYDIFALLPIIFVIIYIVHKKAYDRIPFIIMMSGLFYIVRGIFIVLTPFGNPPAFNGSDPLFNGFSKYDLGVYPSGHAGNVFLLFLLVKDRLYKWIIMICLILVILTLFLAHGHYSIDILSGLFFAYAIKSFGEKHLEMFDLGSRKKASG
jgi:membrane-associated phospholipid phosphatase